MKRTTKSRFLLASIIGGLMLMTLPAVADNGRLSDPEGWIDKLTGFVLIVKGVEKEGNFAPYLEQIGAMRTLFKKEWSHGELYSTYAAMNRLMDMLQNREEGIRPVAAQAIWDFCYQVTPIALHDEHRYPRSLEFGTSEKKHRVQVSPS